MKATKGLRVLPFLCVGLFCVAPRTPAGEAAKGPVLAPVAAPAERKLPADVLEPNLETAKPQAAEGEASWISGFLKSLKFSGYVETSYVWNVSNPNPPADPENVSRLFDSRSNEFSLHAAALTIERPVGDEQYVGFKVTPFIGQDAEFAQAIGLFKDSSGTSESSFDLLDAYVQGYCPVTRTRVRVGKWQTTAGAEVIQGPLNDQFSRSYLHCHAIPFTHTGLLVTQPVLERSSGGVDMLTLGAAVSNGWDNVRDLNDAKALHGMIWFSPDDRVSLAGTYIFSFSEQPGVDDAPRHLVDVVATVRPVKDLKLVANFDWGRESDEALTGRDAVWWGVGGTARFDFSLAGKERRDWFFALRGEHFDDVEGARIPGVGFSGGVRVWEITATLGYMPLEYLLLRAELRYDKANLPIFYDGANREDSHQTTLALSAAFLF